MNKILPQSAIETIDRYLNLPLGNKLVQCPYFKNREGVRAGLKVYLGKGSPEEIIEETNIVAQKEKINLEELNEIQIRQFMEKHNLGIDCSGFIAQALWSVNPKIVKQIASRDWLKNPFRALVVKLRPIENISVKRLTDINNSAKLNKWQDMEVGDFVRTRGGNHVLLITEVKRTKEGIIQEFTYHHSTSYYEDHHGVKSAKVITIYPNEEFKDQNWEEKDSQGQNPTHEGLLVDYSENGIYRLKNKN